MFLRRILSAGTGHALLARVKETTGIVGLDVVPNDREVLISLYTKMLKETQAVPEGESYRKAVESFTRHRLQVCKEDAIDEYKGREAADWCTRKDGRLSAEEKQS